MADPFYEQPFAEGFLCNLIYLFKNTAVKLASRL